MTKLSRLTRSRPPVVLLTGTCGPAMELPLLNSLDLSGVTTIRAKTARPEIIYTVSPAPPMGESSIPTAVVDWYVATLAEHVQRSRSQILFYVPKKTIGLGLASKLGVPFFESQTDPKEKIRIYDAFRSGTLQSLVATSAFGAGIDIDTVDIVVHAGSPRSMIDFSQESGRAGRKGQLSLSIVFRTVINHFAESNQAEGAKEMEQWLEGTAECRRVGLAEYLDGEVATCASLPRANLCDLCRSLGANKPSVTDDILKQIGCRLKVDSGGFLSAQASDDLQPTYQLQTHFGGLASPLQSRKRGQPEGATIGASLVGFADGTLPRSPFRVPTTPAYSSTYKRSKGDVTVDSEAAANRRALLSRVLSSDLTSPLSSVASQKASRPGSYADQLRPLLSRLVVMKGICFLCLGKGELQVHGGGCGSEMMVTSGERSIFEVINMLGNLVKFKLSANNHCQYCYLPAPEGDLDNDFHPRGKSGKCLVFASAAPKALVMASHLWEARCRVGNRICNQSEPLWLQDVLAHCRTMPEPSKENFARMLLSPTDTGELWLVRIFCHMLKQAMKRT